MLRKKARAEVRYNRTFSPLTIRRKPLAMRQKQEKLSGGQMPQSGGDIIVTKKLMIDTILCENGKCEGSAAYSVSVRSVTSCFIGLFISVD